MAHTLKQPKPISEAEQKKALLEKLRRLTAEDEAQRFSLKTASPAILAMRNDPKAALAFLQKCGIYDETGQLAEPYR